MLRPLPRRAISRAFKRIFLTSLYKPDHMKAKTVQDHEKHYFNIIKHTVEEIFVAPTTEQTETETTARQQ